MSLLELLVVFVIISMIASVLAQGFGFGLAIYDRVETRGHQIERDVLSLGWFRGVNGSLVAATEPGGALVGDSESFRATTLNPLLGKPGMPTEIEWSIRDGSLAYVEGDKTFRVWPLSNGAELRYLGPGGHWLTSWPTDLNSYLLPAAVKIVGIDDSTFLATVKVRLKANLFLEESRRDRE